LTEARPRIDVLIVAFENEATIEHTIASLTHIDEELSVAVHDNSPGCGTLQAAERACQAAGLRFRGEHCPTNCGYGRGINSLASRSSAEYLLVLNPDATITTWSSPRLPSAREIIGPHVYRPDGPLIVSWGPPRTLLEDALLKLPLVSRLNVRRLTRMEHRRRLGFLSGVALLTPRAFFEELGGFDSRYFLYYEDVELSGRAISFGGALTVSSRWSVTHTEGHSWRGRRHEQLLADYLAGRRYFGDRDSTEAYDIVCALNALLRWAGDSMMSRPGATEYRHLLHDIRTASRRCGQSLA